MYSLNIFKLYNNCILHFLMHLISNQYFFPTLHNVQNHLHCFIVNDEDGGDYFEEISCFNKLRHLCHGVFDLSLAS